MLKVKVGIKGQKRLLDTIRDMERAGANIGMTFQLVARRMLKMQKKHFTDMRQADGSSWPALSPATIEARRESDSSKGRAPTPLRDTDNLYNSLRESSSKTAAMVGVPTSVSYGVHHQFGSRDGKHPPKREFLYLKKSEQRELIKMLLHPLVVSHLQKGGGGGGVPAGTGDTEELI